MIKSCFRKFSTPVLLFLAVFYTSGIQAQDFEWRQLFNGIDFAGWEHVGPGEFSIEEGVLKSIGGMGLLWYNVEKFENVDIKVVYRNRNYGIRCKLTWMVIEPLFE